MFIPIGHDQSTVRRLPWVTFTIMGLCLLAWLATVGSISSSADVAQQRLDEVAEYYFQNPDLQLHPDLEEYFFGYIPENQGQRDAYKEVIKEAARGFGMMGEEGQEEVSLEVKQQILDDLTRKFHEALGEMPYFRWGLVPANQKAFSYITYQFMHGGFLHLFGNLLFLYLAGPYLEDVWGRPIFTSFYLLAGIAAAAFYCMKYPSMEGPLIGASGAVAGLMGAFLVRHGRTKIRFLFIFFLRAKTFDAPAMIMLPLWLLREAFYGQAVDMAGGSGTGVAHWAHVAGFVFGVVFALAMRHFDVEQGFVEKALDAKSIQHVDLELDAAVEAHRSGDSDRAAALLSAQLAADPGNYEAAAAYWDVARDRGEIEPAVPSMLRVLRDALRRGDVDLIEMRWEEVLEMAPVGSIDPMFAARVGEALADELPGSVLSATVEAGVAGATATTAAGVLVRLARLGIRAKSPALRELIDRALATEDLMPEMREELEEMRASAPAPSAAPAAAPAPPVPDVAPEPGAMVEEQEPGVFEQQVEPVTITKVEHTLKVMEAIPLEWSEGRLTIETQGTVRPLGAHHLEAVAVAGIAEPEKPAYVLVDLMLDAPWSDRKRLRVVRLRSNAFDPRKLVPGEDGQASFKFFLEDILQVSGAAPLPDPDGALGNPFRRFSGIAEYEAEVLGIELASPPEPAE